MLRRIVFPSGMALIVAVASMAQAQEGRQGRGGFGGGSGMFGGGAGMSAFLLAMPEVLKELSVGDEQKGLIEDMVADLRDQAQKQFGSFNREEFQSLSEEERRKRGEEARKKGEELAKKADEMLGMILEPKQVERLGQLRLQREGVGAFQRPEIAEKLGLAQEQKDKMRKIQEEARPDPSMFAKIRDMSDEERREAFTKMRERGEKANADILALLTSEQKETWIKMRGRNFDFPQPQFGFGGRRPGGEGESRRSPEAKKKGDN